MSDRKQINDLVRSLNQPMLDRLRKCAADTSPNWDGAITIYPGEASYLVALIDAAEAVPVSDTPPERRGYETAIAVLRGTHERTGSPAAKWAADYLAADPDRLAPAVSDPARPESYCHRCGGPNITWSAPSPLWNAVMRGNDINAGDEFDGIVCPICFAELAAERVGAARWRLYPESVDAPLVTVTPSGRVWDSDAWMWKDPVPDIPPGDYRRGREDAAAALGVLPGTPLWHLIVGTPDGPDAPNSPPKSGGRWAVDHPGIGVIEYSSEEEARLAAGTAGRLIPPAANEPGTSVGATSGTANESRTTAAGLPQKGEQP